MNYYTLKYNYYNLSIFLILVLGYKKHSRPILGSVDNSSSDALRPAACPLDPEILLNAQTFCTDIARTGSRGEAAGRRDQNCQQTLIFAQLKLCEP
jgi:hypothetical protein